ncbi:MAG: peptidyl-tRNA hydrolase Pth2 [Candidatus Diapherotrites archaeon]|uniref:Peptidyl-tRNA hydrolase n=1 Tax=Candidatus Iainarchaeum sp. TaxID=3101447 RepID=A0A7J4IRS6_9ARCH|nr:peptidyl-tRNA hydrolase Pth2 [Candidatus Diapherotrites archaeon]HIH08211.1 peptidyl-tRNA hydrolase [Candidatus Diapherotrites archaeon]
MVMEFKQLIICRTDLGMGRGKIASQSAHASISAMEKAARQNSAWVEEWKEQGMKKVVLKVSSKKELVEWFETLKKKFPAALIKDAGHTQVQSGEVTCIGIGPAPSNELDHYTRELKLL